MTAFPEIKCVPVTADTEFVVLACDGIWDVMSSQQCTDFLQKHIYANAFAQEAKKKPLTALVKGMEACLDECCAKDLHTCEGLGCDNMTAIIVEFKPQN